METAWRFRIVLFMTFAIIIFGDMLGYANVKGDKDTNHQRTVETIKKNQNHHHHHHHHHQPAELEGRKIRFFLNF